MRAGRGALRLAARCMGMDLNVAHCVLRLQGEVTMNLGLWQDGVWLMGRAQPFAHRCRGAYAGVRMRRPSMRGCARVRSWGARKAGSLGDGEREREGAAVCGTGECMWRCVMNCVDGICDKERARRIPP